MLNINNKRVRKKANSLISLFFVLSFVLVLIFPFCFNFNKSINNSASADVVSSNSSLKQFSLSYVNLSSILTLRSPMTNGDYKYYSTNSIDVSGLTSFIPDYNSNNDYYLTAIRLSFTYSKDGKSSSASVLNVIGGNSLAYSNDNIFYLSGFELTLSNISFNFAILNDCVLGLVSSATFYYYVIGDNSPSQSDYDRYIEENNYHSNEDYLNYGNTKYNEGREFEKSQSPLENCSCAISSIKAVNSSSFDSAYEFNSKPRTILSSKNVNSNYNHVSFFVWNENVKLSDIKNQNFINIDSGVYPIPTGDSFDLKNYLYSGFTTDILGNDIASSLRLVFEFGFKNNSNEFQFSFILDNVDWSSDLVVKSISRLKNICFKLSDNNGNSQIIYGFNVFELYSKYLNDMGNVTTNDYYDLGFSDGVNSIDIESDNEQAISDFIEENNYHSNEDYLNFGKSQYESGFASSENGKDTLSKLVYSIIDAPFNVLSNAFNFDIFGINVSSFLIAVVSLIIIGFVIRRLI